MTEKLRIAVVGSRYFEGIHTKKDSAKTMKVMWAERLGENISDHIESIEMFEGDLTVSEGFVDNFKSNEDVLVTFGVTLIT